MAYTTTWKIRDMQREASDGYVYNVRIEANAVDDSDASIIGQVVEDCILKRPSGTLIPFNDLTESQVIGWVHDQWATQQLMPNLNYKQKVEGDLSRQMEHNKIQNGTPW
tara:strand:+ start:1973 stop:2299 length:327 start_codon:yes stop_codon:yes gene_type:complete